MVEVHDFHIPRIVTLMLAFLSLCYLALPYFIFACGWLQWPYAVAVWLVLLVALALTAVRAGRFQPSSPTTSSRSIWLNWGFKLLITLGLLIVSGIGGFGCQQPEDWLKHNAILHDLTSQDWPVAYPGSNAMPQGSYLTYYIAYYLPAVLVGRGFGLVAAHLALLVWTLLGLVLVAMWLTRLLNSELWILWAAWFALSGMDAVGVLLRGGGDHWTFMEWWPTLGQYSSNVSLLVWVPQHMLPGWIATGLIVDLGERYEDVSLAGFAAALTGLWSPFVTIGLLPVAAVLLVRTRLRTGWTVQNLLAAPVVLLLSAAYLSSVDRGNVPSHWNFLRYDSIWFIKVYPVFCLLEFGIYVFLIAWHLRRPAAHRLPAANWNRIWLGTTAIALVLLPLYRIGIANDLVMRASIPGLFLIWVVLLRVVNSELFHWQNWYSSLLLACLMIGAIQPMAQLGVQVEGTRPRLHFCEDRPQISVLELRDLHQPQYLGRPEAFFYRYLAPRDPIGPAFN